MEPEPQKELNPQLQEALTANEERYRKVVQLSHYTELKNIQQMQIFTKSTYDVQCNILFCFDGEKYNPNDAQHILYFIIRTIEEELPKLKNKKFSIAFIYHSLSDFFQFRKMLHYFPKKYIVSFKSLYIVQAGLIAKIVQKLAFGSYNSFLSSNTVYTQTLEEIQALNKVTFGGNMTKSKMKFKEEKTQSQPVKIIQNKLYGKRLSAYELSKHGMPVLIQSLVIRLYSNRRFVEAEGVMRKSCDIEQLQLLEQHLMQDKNPYLYLHSVDDPYVICGCLKKILNNLFTPLFSYELYDKIIEYRTTGKEEDDIDFVRTCLTKMEPLNVSVLSYLLAFLKRGIVTFKEKNKMSSYNLAVVFGPCLFRPKEYRLEDLMNSGKFSKIIMLLIDNLERIIGEEKAIKIYNLLDEQAAQYKTL